MSYSLLHNSVIPEAIHIGLAKVQDHGETAGSNILSEQEQQEYDEIKNARRRTEFLVTRHLIHAMAEKFGLESDFAIQKDPMGKPYAEVGEQHIFLSIAHCTGNVVCGISESMDLGVDVEPVERQVHEDLGDRIFHPQERNDVTGLEMIRVWTMKEAMVKLQGKGLRTNLNELLLQRIDDALFAGIFNDDKSARICSFDYDGHWISLAYEYEET